MGNVAAMMSEAGYQVTGSDQDVYPPMSTFLEEKGIRLMPGYKGENLDYSPDLCVIGNATSRGNAEVEEILNRKLYYLSMPETLKEFFLRKSHNLVVTGTHGKTTTTSMLAWIFEYAGRQPGYLIGGLAENFGRGCAKQEGKYWILEGDEYDTAFFDKRSKFLHYLPETLIINNVEFDHADIYDSLDAIKLSFRRLVNTVPSQGLVLVNADDAHAIDVTSKALAPVNEVGFSENAAVRIRDVRADGAGMRYRLFDTEFFLPLHGDYNVRNACMATAAAHFYQIPLPVIAGALAGFKGIKRRQEIRFEIGGISVIDDFGHHPTAIRETMSGLRARFAGRKIWALFEPRSNTTRRAVFQHQLPEALALADGVFVAQVARLDQLPEKDRLNPEKVVADIAATGRPSFYEPDAETIVSKLVPLLQSTDVVVVFSNGGFGGIHAKLESALRQRA